LVPQQKVGFPIPNPAFCSVSKGQRRLGEKEHRARSVTPGVALRVGIQVAPLIAATTATSGNCPITESFCSHTANPYVEQDHNLSLVQTTYTAQNLFVAFNTSTAQYNLELKGTAKTNPAIGTGNSSLMPATDFLGHSRSASSPDLGAYGVPP
jgi:hypothetical protein